MGSSAADLPRLMAEQCKPGGQTCVCPYFIPDTKLKARHVKCLNVKTFKKYYKIGKWLRRALLIDHSSLGDSHL